MWSLFFESFDEGLIAELWERGTTGIWEETNGVRAYFDDSANPVEIAKLGGELRREASATLSSQSESCEPLEIGERFYIVPRGLARGAPAGRLKIELHAGAAFGTGRHETTQLSLEAMECFLRPGAAVLDVGCGSGILSSAASLLGARHVFSCDIDQNAVELTRRSARTLVFAGSADAIATHSTDVVIANLTTAVLERLAWDLKRVTKPEGLLLLSGFLRGRVPAHFHPEHEIERDEWLCWVCRPEGINATRPAVDGLTHEAEWWL